MSNEKFCIPYIEFVNSNFKNKTHIFVLLKNDGNKYGEIPELKNVIDFSNVSIVGTTLKLLPYMMKAEKIIFHGLFEFQKNLIYTLNPWVLKKSYWVMWGGDLYEYLDRDEKYSFKNRIMYKIIDFIKGNMKGYISHINGDYVLAQKWFGAKGKYYHCLMYLSNIYKEVPISQSCKEEIWVQIGNSADSTNNHKEILEKLLKYKYDNIKLYCPLSYGNARWAQEIKEYGENLFGNKFIAMMDYISFEEYCNFNNSIDIAIFAHNRQQAVGNIISLLGMGKTVYLRKEVTTTTMLDEIGLKYYDFEQLNELREISFEDKKNNILKIKENFSEEKLIEQWGVIFND